MPVSLEFIIGKTNVSMRTIKRRAVISLISGMILLEKRITASQIKKLIRKEYDGYNKRIYIEKKTGKTISMRN